MGGRRGGSWKESSEEDRERAVNLELLESAFLFRSPI